MAVAFVGPLLTLSMRQACTPSALDKCTPRQLLGLSTCAALDRDNPDGDPLAVKAAITKRAPLTLVLSTLRQTGDACKRELLIAVAAESRDSRTAGLFRQLLTRERDRGSMLIAVYLARQGDRKALGILDENYYAYQTSSLDWAQAMTVFGEQRYYAVVPKLIASLDAASLNVVDAAFDVLGEMYPGTPKEFGTLAEARTYFERRYSSGPPR